MKITKFFSAVRHNMIFFDNFKAKTWKQMIPSSQTSSQAQFAADQSALHCKFSSSYVVLVCQVSYLQNKSWWRYCFFSSTTCRCSTVFLSENNEYLWKNSSEKRKSSSLASVAIFCKSIILGYSGKTQKKRHIKSN